MKQDLVQFSTYKEVGCSRLRFFLLRQTQAGIAVASFRQTPDGDGFLLDRPIPGAEAWPTAGRERWTWDGQVAQSSNDVLRYTYRFVEGGLASVTVHQVGHSSPSFELSLQPALPDLRRPFAETVRSDFVMAVNGQAGHGTGEIAAKWIGPGHAEVTITPTAPHWLADRPLRSTIILRDDGSVDVQTERIAP